MNMTLDDILNIASFSGSLAVSMVALFKEQIQSLFIKAKFQVKVQNDGLDEEVVNDQAIRYSSFIEVSNVGKKYADDCSIYMDGAKYYPHNGNPNTPLKEIRRQLSPIDWDNMNTESGIPPKGHRVVEIFRMIQPGEMNDPNSSKTTTPTYFFAGLNKEESNPGTWNICYSIYSKNSEVFKFELTVSWSGEWKPRLKEMSSVIDINIKSL